MTKDIKTKAKTIGHDTNVSIKNLLRLIEASSLLIVSYYNFTTAYHAHLTSLEFKVRVAASVVIGLRGAYEFMRYLAQKEA